MTKAGAGKQNLLLAWEARRARPGRNSCVRNLGAGRGSRPDRSAGRLGGAVPGCSTRRGSGRGKMAAVKGLETCLRVAGAAAARPERFLRYCGLTESPPTPSPMPDTGCAHVALRSWCGPQCSGRGGLVAAGRRPSAPRGSAEIP